MSRTEESGGRRETETDRQTDRESERERERKKGKRGERVDPEGERGTGSERGQI